MGIWDVGHQNRWKIDVDVPGLTLALLVVLSCLVDTQLAH